MTSIPYVVHTDDESRVVDIKLTDPKYTQYIAKYFSDHYGFGSYTSTAVTILSQVINVLDEFNINYFLISGTLLGYARHNSFIP